jgi:hypothetical protein
MLGELNSISTRRGLTSAATATGLPLAVASVARTTAAGLSENASWLSRHDTLISEGSSAELTALAHSAVSPPRPGPLGTPSAPLAAAASRTVGTVRLTPSAGANPARVSAGGTFVNRERCVERKRTRVSAGGTFVNRERFVERKRTRVSAGGMFVNRERFVERKRTRVSAGGTFVNRERCVERKRTRVSAGGMFVNRERCVERKKTRERGPSRQVCFREQQSTERHWACSGWLVHAWGKLSYSLQYPHCTFNRPLLLLLLRDLRLQGFIEPRVPLWLSAAASHGKCAQQEHCSTFCASQVMQYCRRIGS